MSCSRDIIINYMFNELSSIIRISFHPFFRTNYKIHVCYHFWDEIFNSILLEFCNEVLPFEQQGSQKVEDEPNIQQSVRKESYSGYMYNQWQFLKFYFMLKYRIVCEKCRVPFEIIVFMLQCDVSVLRLFLRPKYNGLIMKVYCVTTNKSQVNKPAAAASFYQQVRLTLSFHRKCGLMFH